MRKELLIDGIVDCPFNIIAIPASGRGNNETELL